MTDDQDDRVLGADVLEQYFTDHYPSVNAVAREHGFDQAELSKIRSKKLEG